MIHDCPFLAFGCALRVRHYPVRHLVEGCVTRPSVDPAVLNLARRLYEEEADDFAPTLDPLPRCCGRYTWKGGGRSSE